MRRRARKALLVAGEILGALLFVVSILVTLVRVGLPQADRLHGLAESWATAAAGSTVQIGALDTYWRGLNPSLSLSDVSLLDAQGAVLVDIHRADLVVDLFASLATGTLQFNELHLDGLNLIVEQRPDGLLLANRDDAGDAAGAEDRDDPDEPPAGLRAREAIAWLFAQKRIELSSALVWWTAPEGPQVAEVALLVENRQGRHRFGVRLQPVGSGGSLLLRGDLFGDARRPETWSGPLYLRGDSLLPEGLLAALPVALPASWSGPLGQALRLLPDRADFELWSRFDLDGPRRVTGRLSLQPGEQGAVAGRLVRGSARFDWQVEEAGGWRLDLADVGVEGTGGRGLWIGPAAFTRSADGTLAGGISALSIDEIAALVAGLEPLTPPQRETLQGLSPGGMLYRIHGHRTPGGGRWRVAGEVWGAGVDAWNRVPGLRGLRGDWQAGPDGLELLLDAYSAEADLPGLFRDTLQVDRARGRLALLPIGDGWRIEADGLELANEEVSTRTQFRLELPAGGGAEIDLLSRLEGDVAATSRYLPAGVMAPKLVAWLDRALVSGRLREGTILIRGPLADYPFRDGGGRFEMSYDVERTRLDYQPGWPAAEQVDGVVRLDGKGVRIEIRDGRLAGSRVRQTTADIAQATAEGERMLRIEGRLEGSLATARRLLLESPLKPRFEGYFATVDGQGPMRADLALAIPLRGGRVTTRGSVAVRDARLRIVPLGTELERVDGTLRFTESSLTAESLRAVWDGSPVDFALQVPATADGRDVAVRVDGRGSVDAARLAAHLPAPYAARVRGKAAVNGTLAVSAGADGHPGDLRLTLHSTLEGLQLDLPEPLGKPAPGRMPLQVRVDLAAGRPAEVSARYGDLATLRGRLGGPGGAGSLERAALKVGGEAAAMPATAGWHVAAELPLLQLDPWLGLVHGGTGDGRSGPPPVVDLQAGTLRFGSLPLRRARLGVRHGDDGWRVRIDSDELAGELILPTPWHRGGTLRAALDRCHVRSGEGGTGSGEPGNSPDPTTLPGIDIDCADFRLDGAALGRMQAVAEPDAGGLQIRRLRFDSPLLRLDGSGQWEMTANGPQTRLEMVADAPRIDRLLEAFEFQSPVSRGRTTARMDLGWVGAPYQPRLRSLHGALRLDVGEGELRELEPGVGRLFGLLSVATLGRRLRLDFSDLFQTGLSFDRLGGDFTLDAGEAYTSNFTLDAPSAEVVIMGRTGLTEKDYDQLVTVTPKVTSSLPVVGTLAGGPAVGAAMLLFERVFGSTLNRITQNQYQVTGSWDAPTVQRLLPGPGAPVDSVQ